MKQKLIDLAMEQTNNSYAPYSSFCVGAALLSESGKIYTGCNIENASFGETICAERVAFTSAISEGEREFKAIAIVSKDKNPCFPCGSCRQFMSEFCKKDFKIYLKDEDTIKEYSFENLFPHSFKLEE